MKAIPRDKRTWPSKRAGQGMFIITKTPPAPPRKEAAPRSTERILVSGLAALSRKNSITRGRVRVIIKVA